MISTLHPGPSSSTPSEHPPLPHILFVIDQLKTFGGAERILFKLVDLLPLYGYQASILTFSADIDHDALVAPPCPVYLLPLTKTYDLAALRAAFCLRTFLQQQQIQLVETFFESSDIWAGLITKMMSNVKLIWSRRDMGILRTGKHRLAYKLMSNLPDAVFAVSDLVRQHCIEVDGIHPDSVHTIYNGLDLAEWDLPDRSHNPPENPVITTVGNIRHVKGHDVLVRAAASVVQRFPLASFSIAGDVLEASYFAGLQSMVANLGLTKNFCFVGGVKNLREHLTQSDIFVLPSRSEGFSNAVVEAMAASMPVIATQVGGNAEAVLDNVTGLIIPPDDPAALAAAIIRLIEDPALARQMGCLGRRRVSERFALEAMMQQTVAVFDRLLAEA